MATQIAESVQSPNYVIDSDGEPVAVVVPIATWRSLIDYVENIEDFGILKSVTDDLRTLVNGNRPNGWKSWDDFEAEIYLQI